MLTFAHPWLLVLLPLPWLVRWLLPPGRTPLVGVRVPFGGRLRQALRGGSSLTRAGRGPLRWVVSGMVWLLVLIALARPQWLEPPIEKNLPTRDLLLLVDLSGSMRQEDFTNAEGETVDRLSAVKEVLGEFLVKREGDRVGLVVFGDSPFLQAPFSTDLSLSRTLLDETSIGMAGPRTAFGDAIGLGVNLFRESEAPAKTMIALTDGNDTKSQVPPVEAARVAAQQDIRIHTVAIGDPATVGEEKLDEATLREVAGTAGGSYFFAADRSELAGIYAELDRIETRQVTVVSHRPRTDLFHWPLLAATLLSLAARLVGVMGGSGRHLSPQAPTTRVYVDPLTGKLDVII